MSNSNNQVLRVAVYTRVSTEEQGEYLMEEQLIDLKRYVKQNKECLTQVLSKGRVK